MNLDLVHDIQKTYRKVLNCMSRPGLIEDIEEHSCKVDIDIDFLKPTLVMMILLLDAEVSFKIFSEKEEEITKLVNQLTYAKAKSVDEADFIFILRDAAPCDIDLSFREAKQGSLIDPHKSATIILETEEVSNKKDLQLKGPGMKEENYCGIMAEGSWVEERSEKNAEYPMGVDTIFIDSNSNIMCIPRTTDIKMCESKTEQVFSGTLRW